jgi:hypothetical protein
MPIGLFQIALVNKVPRSYPYFDYRVQNEITFTLWDYLARIAIAAGGFIPGPSWSLWSSLLQDFDSVIYFVLNPDASITRRVPGTPGPSGRNLGGFTVSTSKGVICEVYVDGNLPARRLANIAFHEFMHNRLDVGARVVTDLHTRGGGGLAQPPTSESSQLRDASVKLLAKHIWRSIPQYKGAM